jgi:hypothetical protein
MYGHQHHPASFAQHFSQPAPEQIHLTHPAAYPGIPAPDPQLTIRERRIASMPTKSAVSASVTHTAQPTAAEFDLNEHMRRSIIIPARSSIISPNGSPSVEIVSPPLSTTSRGDNAGKAPGATVTKTKTSKRAPKRKRVNPLPEDEDIDDDDDDDVGGGGKKESVVSIPLRAGQR